MSREFYEKYASEEQEVIALIQKTAGASSFDDEWNMLAITLGMVFCKDHKVDIRKGRLNWLVSAEERNSEKGWGRFQKGQICRIKVRKMLDLYAPENLAVDAFTAVYSDDDMFWGHVIEICGSFSGGIESANIAG